MPVPAPIPFKFVGNYPCPYPTMRVFTHPSWVFFAGGHWAWVQLPSLWLRDDIRRPAASICMLGEMTITLDDVACLLGIPVVGRLIQDDDLDHDQGVDLMVTHILFPVEEAVEQVGNNSGAFVTYMALKSVMSTC